MRMCYGEIDCYMRPYHTRKQIADLVRRALRSRKGFFLDRPFYREGDYIFVLGRKKKIVHGGGNLEGTFAVHANCKDPLTPYKARFLKYLSLRVPELAKRMSLDVDGFRIRDGLFLSYYGCCFPTKRQIKFDYRLYAYAPEIIDSVIYHELTHLYVKGHDDRFYKILYLYCPDYDRLQDMLAKGVFEGEKGI